MHRQGYAHRDIKPENICLRAAAADMDSPVHGDRQSAMNADVLPINLTLVDFGMACPATDSSVNKDFTGSLGFFAPEMLTGDQEYNPLQADAFSCGAVLLEATIGSSAYEKVWLRAYGNDYVCDPPQFDDAIRKAAAAVGAHEGIRASRAGSLICDLLVVDPRKRLQVTGVSGHDFFDRPPPALGNTWMGADALEDRPQGLAPIHGKNTSSNTLSALAEYALAGGKSRPSTTDGERPRPMLPRVSSVGKLKKLVSPKIQKTITEDRA